jgi:hypothetical protein
MFPAVPEGNARLIGRWALDLDPRVAPLAVLADRGKDESIAERILRDCRRQLSRSAVNLDPQPRAGERRSQRCDRGDTRSLPAAQVASPAARKAQP